MESFDKVINWLFLTTLWISIKTSFYQYRNNWQRMLKAYSHIARHQFTTQDDDVRQWIRALQQKRICISTHCFDSHKYQKLLPLTSPRYGACHWVTAFQGAGRSTWSMTCITPLQAMMSALMTLALFTIVRLLDTLIMTESPLRVSTSPVSRSVLRIKPSTTWYKRISLSVSMLLGRRRSSRTSSGRLAKASLVGAKTVKGPSPERAPTKSAAARAVTKVEKSSFSTAISTMVPCVHCLGLGLYPLDDPGLDPLPDLPVGSGSGS